MLTTILAIALAIVWLSGFVLMLSLTDFSGASSWRKVGIIAGLLSGWPVIAFMLAHHLWRSR